MRRLPPLLTQPVNGINLASDTLEPLLNTPTLLVFLRHFGCIFCREMVADLRQISHAQPDYPPILFFYQGTTEEGEAFFDHLWPEAKAVADAEQHFYSLFGLSQGSAGQMFGPEVWACGVRAAFKGHFIGAPVGDPWMMPGVFFVEGDAILWEHTFNHAGDHPDFKTLPTLLGDVGDEARLEATL
ncbi:MAG: SelL-related redox protein [Deinococcota bacterium]